MKILSSTLYPIKNQIEKFTQANFGVVRKHDIHTGVDIYCEEGTKVFSAEAGKVVHIETFTGTQAESPWWNETFAVVVKGKSGYLLYGEIKLSPELKIGSSIKAGQELGTVCRVLKQDKGTNPTTMLHFEMYSSAPFGLWWKLNEKRPENLLDPTEFLLKNLK